MSSSFKSTVFLNKGLSVSLLTGLIISTASLYAPMANAAAIYKVVDEKTGQVTFTDRPQNYEQQAGKQISQTSVMTSSDSVGANSSSQTNNANNQPVNTTQASAANSTGTTSTTANSNKTANKAPINYQLTITEPSEERAYRRPVQSIDVKVQVKPALQAGDSVSIYLDGNEVAQGLSASIATVDVLPGAHNIKAVIKNKKGQVEKQVERTVYVIQTLQKNKKLAEQLLAYQRLPWYQKVLLKMRQDGKQPNMLSFTKPIVDTPMTLEEPVKK